MRPALGFCGTASGSSSPASPSAVPRCSISDRRRACGRTRASSLEAAKQARGEGLVTAGEYERLERELA